MPILDLLVVLGAIAVGLLGASAIRLVRARRRAEDPRALAAAQRAAGERNAEQLQLEESRLCVVCSQPTDPSVDLYIQDAWYHRACYQALSAEALKSVE